MCVWVGLILIMYITFCYNVTYLCGCLYVQYKYNITLYNLIIKKYRGFVTCVYCYHVIITFCYKTSDSKKKII